MAYSNIRYSKYRHSPNIITPPKEIEAIQAIEKIEPPEPIQPIYGYQSLTAKQEMYKRARQDTQMQTFLSNYNDPTELNSYIDALLNREAVSKRFGETWGAISTASGAVAALSWIGAVIASFIPGGQPVAAALMGVGTVAAVPSIPAMVDVTIEKGIKPILAGKPKEALLNTLMNIGETADVVANPVKGLILEGPEGFVKGTGLADGGRVNYDYDTGFFLTDMVLEAVSDPLNWVDWGASLGTHFSAKALAKPQAQILTNSIKQAALETGETLTEENLELLQKNATKTYTRIAKQVTDATALKELSETARDNLNKTCKKQIKNTLTNTLRKIFPDKTAKELDTLIGFSGKALKDARHLRGAARKINNFAFDKLTTDVMRGLSRMQHYSNAFQKFLNKGALFSSGYGAAWEVAKRGVSKGLNWWQDNVVLKSLQRATFFDPQKGIDIKHWADAKQSYNAWSQYIPTVSGETVIRSPETFYDFGDKQFRHENRLLHQTFEQHLLQPNVQIADLNTLTQELHGCSFEEYIGYLKGINELENGRYTRFVEDAETLLDHVKSNAVNQRTGHKMVMGKQLSNIQDVTLEKITSDVKILKSDKPKDARKFYGLQLNKVDTTNFIINQPKVRALMEEIVSDDGLGGALKKLGNEVEISKVPTQAAIYVKTAPQILKQSATSFMNISRLYDNVGMLPLSNIKLSGVSDNQLKRYILDEIFGLTGTTTELLSNFDATLAQVMNGLDMLTYDPANPMLQISKNLELQTSVSEVLKDFLQNQRVAGIEDWNAAVLQDFTTSANQLINNFPQYADEFANLKDVNKEIYDIMNVIKTKDEELLNIFTTQNTIFSKTDRELSELGLARRIIAETANLEHFDLPKNKTLSGIQISSINTLGRRIQYYIDGFGQYSVEFTDPIKEHIATIYEQFRNTFFNQENILDTATPDYLAFGYLKATDDPYEQLATIAQFYSLNAADSLKVQQMNTILYDMAKNEKNTRMQVVSMIKDPEQLLHTDFALDAMKQAAWVAEKQFQEDAINAITRYKNLALSSRKLTHDMQTMRELLAENKYDRPKALQQERYVRVADKWDKVLTRFEEIYNNRFDQALANTEINDLYSTLLRHPRFEEHRATIEEIEQYWHGEKSFQQDSKRYLEKGFKPDGTKAVDEFTPFWKRVKKMNKTYVDIQRSEITEAAIRDKLTGVVGTEWFDNSTKGADIVDILTNSSRKLSQEDFELYQEFLAQMKLGSNAEIPWEYIPAQFKEVEFRYYYDVLGIDDPRLVYDYLDHVNEQGWHTRRTNNIIGHILPNRSVGGFDNLRRTFVHESGHNVLERVFPTVEARQDWLQNVFKTRFVEIFGQETFDDIYEAMQQLYMPYYNSLPIEEFAENILEEMFTFSVAETLPEFLSNPDMAELLAKHLTEDTVLKGIFFADDLYDSLADMAKEAGLNTTAQRTFNQFYNSKQTRFFTDNTKIVTPWDPVHKQQQLNKVINQATDADAKNTLYRFFQMDSDQTVKELAFRRRFVTFTDNDIADNRLNGMFKKYVKTLDSSKIHHVHTNGRHWLILDKNQQLRASGRSLYLNGELLNREINTRSFDALGLIDQELAEDEAVDFVKNFDQLSQDLETLTGSSLGDSQGEYLDQRNLQRLFALDNRGDLEEIPQEVRDLLLLENEGNNYGILDKQFFDAFAFNESVLGTQRSKAALGVYSGNIVTNARNALVNAKAYLKPRTEYVDAVFNSTLSINSPNSVWTQFTDEELLDALQSTTDYKLMALVHDKKYGLRTRDILPASVKAIQKARELGAVIVPLQVAKDMYNVINHRIGSSGMAKLWSRIMYVYKFGYLCRPGAWIRNFIDTNLKSKLEMGNEYLPYQVQAHKILNQVESIKDFVQSRDKEGVLRLTAIKEWFEQNADSANRILDYDQFMELDQDFLSQGISGNIMGDLYPTEGGDLWRTFTETTGKIIDSANKTEDYNRLAMYLYELDHGLDYTGALSKLSKIHFDYSFKSKTEQLVDMVFPFTTFSMRNLSYWVEKLEQQPWILRNYAHLMKPHWDFKDYTPEELARDRRVQTQILYGQLKLGEFSNKIITFKANPSIQDAIQMFTDPINNVYEKLAAPISTPIQMAQGETPNYLNLVPGIGPAVQAVQTMVNTGSPAPSVIGIQQAPRRTGRAIKFSNPNLSGTDKYTDKTYRTPRYRKNIIYDSYAVKGVKRYRLNLYPIIDIAHEVQLRYSVDAYNRIKNRVQKDVYKGIRYRIRLDTNRFR